MEIIDSIIYHPIGIIHSNMKTKANTPIQSSANPNIKGYIEIFPDFQMGLKDLEGFNYIFLLYHFNRIMESKLRVIPFLDVEKRGIFSTRAPSRPNSIGFSLVEILEIKNNIINFNHCDILDNTPLLDIKPFIPEFDCENVKGKQIKIGWLSNKIHKRKNATDDGRFL